MRNNRKLRSGVVVSDKMDKTIIVRVDNLKAHPKYKKVFRVSKKYHVHDEKGEAKIGDTVNIMETKPLSKTKCWRLVSIDEGRAKVVKKKFKDAKEESKENIDNVESLDGEES